MNLKSRVRDFIRGLLSANGDTGDLADHDSILISGRLQSIDAVEIVVFVEESFGIDFAKVGFDRERIDSVDAICTLIEATSQYH